MEIGRRNFAFAVAGITAGLAMPGDVVPVLSDSKLVKTCRKFMALHGELEALHRTRRSIEDERRTEPELERIEDQIIEVKHEIEDLLPPKSYSDALAIAWASLASAMKTSNRKWSDVYSFSEIAAFSVAEWMLATAPGSVSPANLNLGT